MKRQGSEDSDSLKEHPPLKTQHRDSDNGMRRDIANIKKGLKNMADEEKEDISHIKDSLEEVYYELREEKDIINNMLADILAEVQQNDD